MGETWTTAEQNVAHACRTGLHNAARLTDASVLLIRQRLAAGEQGKQIAASIGISPSAISQIKTGKCWKWVA